ALRPQPTSSEAPAPNRDFTAGTMVRLLHLNTEAVVVEPPSKGQLRVSVGGLKMSVPLEQVHVPPPKRAPAPRPHPHKAQKKPKTPPREDPSGLIDVTRTSHNTCDLRGQRVDDGLLLVDQFLDEMLRMHEPAA